MGYLIGQQVCYHLARHYLFSAASFSSYIVVIDMCQENDADEII